MEIINIKKNLFFGTKWHFVNYRFRLLFSIFNYLLKISSAVTVTKNAPNFTSMNILLCIAEYHVGQMVNLFFSDRDYAGIFAAFLKKSMPSYAVRSVWRNLESGFTADAIIDMVWTFQFK